MSFLKSIKGWLYVAVSGAVMAYVAKHPEYHDVSLILLGVIAHALGVETGKQATVETMSSVQTQSWSGPASRDK